MPEKPIARGLFNRAGVRYEVACEVIGSLIAHQAELIARELDEAVPDEGKLHQAHAERARLVDAREALDPADQQGVEDAISRFGQLSRAAYGFPDR